MRRSAISLPWISSTPSAPTPVCRSQTRRASTGQSTGCCSRSSTTRKSLPSPCIFSKRIQNLVDQRLHGTLAALQPPDAAVPAEPGALRLGVATGALRDKGGGLFRCDLSVDSRERLAVADSRRLERVAGGPTTPCV